MAGKIIADTIEASGSQISLNVGNVTVLTASSTGLTLIPTTNVNVNLTNSIVTLTNGSATSPGLTFSGNTRTGLFMPSANTLAFTAANTESMRIDSSGNVGIGTNSPSSFYSEARNLVVGTGTGGQGMTIYAGTASQSRIMFADGTTGSDPYTGFVQYDHSSNALTFGTNGGTERMRIDSSGKVGINTSGAAYGGTVFRLGVNDTNYCIAVNATAGGTTDMIDFYSSGAFAGKVSSSGATTAYNTSSDYRLKEDITPLTGALTKVSALKPVTFKWKLDGNSGEGFIAHELAEVCPYAVNGEKDEVDAEGNIKAQSIDTSFLVATLTAAIQELKVIVDAQAVEIAALKAK